jgi:hypothetical protein
MGWELFFFFTKFDRAVGRGIGQSNPTEKVSNTMAIAKGICGAAQRIKMTFVLSIFKTTSPNP